MWDAVRVQIGALGPLTIGGRTVEGSRLPALLLPLLLARGRIVPAADLVEAVWEGAPPADPTGALQALVSRTRRLGLTITATAGGYRLDPRHLEVDVLVAQDLLARARAATSAGDVCGRPTSPGRRSHCGPMTAAPPPSGPTGACSRAS